MARQRQESPLRLTVIILVGGLLIFLARPKPGKFKAIDRVPERHGKGTVKLHHGQMVLRIAGTPEELGTQHGRLLRKSIRKMLKGYVERGVFSRDAARKIELLARVRRMKPSLPDWYLRELGACATAAEVDEDTLLLAQCEGDICALRAQLPGPVQACSAYVGFGVQGEAPVSMRVGRNFDYYAGSFIHNCVLTTYTRPAPGDGHAFVAVGWSGILGGWTLVNTHRLVVANHLGGGWQTNPTGIPTLVMTRIIAQKAATIAEALELLETLPRMRGQIVWMAQPADPEAGREARAVAVEFDAERMFVREAVNGILIVTNQDFIFGRDTPRIPPENSTAGPYGVLLTALKEATGHPNRRVITATGQPFTLHSVEIDMNDGTIDIAHGSVPAQAGPFVTHRLPTGRPNVPEATK